MQAIEFTTELGPEPVLTIPPDIAGRLPKTGLVRVVVLPESEADRDWRLAAYEQFALDDAPEDAVYDNF